MSTSPIHVAFMVGSLRMGGAERMMINTANELSKKIRVSFISLTGGDDLKAALDDSVHLHCFQKTKSLSAFTSVCGFLKKEKTDVLISTQIHVNLIAVLLKIFCRTGTRIVLREATSPGSQFEEFRTFRWRLVKVAVRWLYPKADAVVAICDAVKEDLLRNRFAKPQQVHVIYNPVVNDRLRAASAEQVTHPFFHSGCPVIISIGRLVRAKNFSLLIKAFAALSDKRDARLLIIGEGPEKSRLESLAEDLGIEMKVDFTGMLANPYPYLTKSSAYVLSSLYEGLPNALIEAMACGIQLVSVDCPGGSREILEDGKAGRIVPMNDEIALAKAIEAAMDHPVDTSILQESVRRFEASKIAGDYLNLITKVMS